MRMQEVAIAAAAVIGEELSMNNKIGENTHLAADEAYQFREIFPYQLTYNIFSPMMSKCHELHFHRSCLGLEVLLISL